jgi:hypothetical protein
MKDLRMRDADRLTQRFVDDELSAEERIELLARLGRDEGLRRQVLELEQLALDARRLPRASLPPGFVEGVLERAMPAPRPVRWWQPPARALVAPRTLRWNLAGAAAAVAVVALGLAAVMAGLARAPEPPAAPLASAELPVQTVLVRLIVVLPNADTVEVAGDFNGWDPARTPLAPAGEGAWTVMLPLEPGRYEYMFVVNGQQWMADPFAVERSDDGFGSQNAVLDVRPAGSV